MLREADVDAGETLHAPAVQLKFFVESPVYFRFDMRDRRVETEADVGFQVPEKILAVPAGLPAINDVGERVVEPVREAELLERAVDALVRVDGREVARAGDVRGFIGLRVKLDVEKFRAESPVRFIIRNQSSRVP